VETNLLDNEDFKTIIHSLPSRNGRIHGADELRARSLFTLFCFILSERLGTAFTHCYAQINSRTSSVTGFSPFFATHGYDIEPIETEEPLRTKGIIPIAKEEAFIFKLKNVTKMAQIMMAAAQEKYETYANTHRQPFEQFKVGDKVWLNLKNIATDRPCKKLDWKNAKYTVIKLVNSHAVRLNTPPGIHNVFHVMLLRKAANNLLPSQIVHEPQPLALTQENKTEKYDVEKILNHALSENKHKTLKLLVKWKNYTKSTWKPANKFEDIKAYEEYLASNDVSKPSARFKRGQRRKKQEERQKHLEEKEGNVTGCGPV
jgi:hypothetical protein